MVFLFALVTILLATASASAKDPLLEASRWRFFGDPGEIASLYTNDLVQEIGGGVWLTTDRGLAVHDGVQFVRKEVSGIPPDARYRSLLCSADGTIWVGTSEGLVKYLAHEWQYPVRKGNVTALAESADGAIWVGVSPATDEEGPEQLQRLEWPSVAVYQRRMWREYRPGAETFPPLPVRLLYGDQDGGVWAVLGSPTGPSSVFRHFAGRWRNMTRQIGLPAIAILSIAQTRDGAYWFGSAGHGVLRWKDGELKNYSEQEAVAGFTAASLLPMPDGSLWAVGSPAGTLLEYAADAWTAHSVRQVGVTGRVVSKIAYSLDDAFWFVIPGRGVARFDRRGGPWWAYDAENGLPGSARVICFQRGRHNVLWVGTSQGLLVFDGRRFTPAQVPAGLRERPVSALLSFPDGRLWMALEPTAGPTEVWENSGTEAVPFWKKILAPPEIPLTKNTISSLLLTRSGDVWVASSATGGPGGKGLFRFRAGAWQSFSQADGLANENVHSIVEDTAGGIWAGTQRGVSRFDGTRWRTFRFPDGPAFQKVWALCAARDGSVWAGGNTPNAGVSRFSNGKWTHYSVDDGLASDDVWSIVEDEQGTIWVSTARGVSRFYRGQWLTFRKGSGLAEDQVSTSVLSGDGSLLFGHFDGAISRYHATSSEPPRSFIEPLPERVAHPGFLTVRWRGSDLLDRTPVADLLYSWRLDAGEPSPFVPLTSHTFATLPAGEHVFTVRTLDQEGNDDGTGVAATFAVEAPFWRTGWFLIPTILGAAGVVFFAGIAWQRNLKWRHAQAQLVGELQREMQVAQRLQTGLLPREDPVIPGFEVTGFCKAASRVGGDYFAYIWKDEERRRFGVVTADVTGHAMQAAIPAVLFSGMLATATRQTAEPARILEILNESFMGRAAQDTFISCTVALFDGESCRVSLANAGGLDPLLRSGTGANALVPPGERLPLGVASGVRYQQVDQHLQQGDLIVFLSDGVVEAKSPSGELFGFRRAEEAIRDCETVFDTRESLLASAAAHMGSREQEDDITIVAVRVTD